MRCRICGNEENNVPYTAYEMFLGTREEFEYFQCDRCKCVQITEIPGDMDKYYPADQFAAQQIPEYDFSKHDRTNETQFIARSSDLYCRFVQGCGIKNLNRTFLDVECGSGIQTRILGSMGFKKAIGIDSFLFPEYEYESDNCKVYKASVFDIDEKFDFITMFNSLEHMTEHKEVLLKIRDLLTDDGILHISMPIATYAWHVYKTDWVQLDAPRHFIIHSYASLNMLLEQTGFQISRYYTESTKLQFLFSELYKKGIPWKQIMSESITTYFTSRENEHYEEMSKKLDKKNQGDQLMLYLEKKK